MIALPDSTEYAPYFAGYIREAGREDPVESMRHQLESTGALLDAVPRASAGHRYADGKWTVRQVVGHLADTERIMAYRALRIARGDTTPLPGFDQDTLVALAEFDGRELSSLVEEWRSVRRASITLFAALSAEALARTGTVSDGPMSARALAYIIAGHERHHVEMLRSRYALGSA